MATARELEHWPSKLARDSIQKGTGNALGDFDRGVSTWPNMWMRVGIPLGELENTNLRIQ